MSRARELLACLVAGAMLGCGGPASETPAPSVAHAEPGPEPQRAPAPEPEPEPAPEPAPAPEPEPTPEPAAPEPEPVEGGTSEALHAAILAASLEEPALLRLIDPVGGIGTYDTSASGSGLIQHCDPAEAVNHSGVAFNVAEEDRWRCGRDLHRCQVSSRDGGGYVFFFRPAGSGDRVWLDAIIHHERTVPNRDSAAVRRFVQGGAGVCDLYRAITEEEPTPPARFSDFVSRHTGLVPEIVAEHHCGAEAAQRFGERLASVPTGQSFSCGRTPARCTLPSGDVEYTFYALDGGAMAFTVTRPGMFANLAREQQRDVDRFLRDARGHACE